MAVQSGAIYFRSGKNAFSRNGRLVCLLESETNKSGLGYLFLTAIYLRWRPKSMKVSVIVFEINEIDGMRAMMPLIRKEWYDELIVVDGGSTDGTLEYIKENGYPYFIQKNRGVGAALNEAMKKVTGDVILIFAPDGSFIPDKIPLMLEKIKEGHDIVNVTRYGYGAKSYDDNFFTSMGNMTFSLLAKIVTGWNITDFLYTYLAFKKSVLVDIQLDTDEITIGQIMLLRAYKKGLKIVEIPSDEPARIGGKVKVRKLRAAYALLVTIIKDWYMWKPKNL